MATPSVNDPDFHPRLARALGAAYELGDRLGFGGFAEVYAAVDTQLKRDVAVKVLRPELAGAVVRERFRREAETVARVRHPNIVPIYAVGEGEGLAWYVMPRLTGGSLRARLDREGRLPAAEVRRVLLESASALAVAHRAGLVHRDIKPDNIMLDGDDAHVLLMDFGIAKALGVDAQGLTATGVAIGTPQYMSPEQASGEAVDQRSDIYSLGVVAYQMLTGQLPFEAGTVAAMLVKQIVEEAPSVLRKRPDCPPDLAAAVTRCLAKAPDQRWASADAFIQALSGTVATTKGARRSGARAAAGVPEALFRFRVTSGISVAGVALGAGIDLAMDRVLVAPLAALVGAFVVAAGYGSLWTAGYGWSDVFWWRRRGGKDRTPVPLDSAEFGPHAEAIRQARNDRMTVLALVERAPKVDRRGVSDVIPTLDLAVAHATDLARHLYGVERQMEPGLEEIDGRLAATRAEPPSPGRQQRVTMLERRREAVVGLAARRAAISGQLERCLAAIGRLRLTFEQVGSAGLPTSIDAIRSATRGLEGAVS
jgi:tRNA A-37 threonylcarbamoyl transferase component Bud32